MWVTVTDVRLLDLGLICVCSTFAPAVVWVSDSSGVKHHLLLQLRHRPMEKQSSIHSLIIKASFI